MSRLITIMIVAEDGELLDKETIEIADDSRYACVTARKDADAMSDADLMIGARQ